MLFYFINLFVSDSVVHGGEKVSRAAKHMKSYSSEWMWGGSRQLRHQEGINTRLWPARGREATEEDKVWVC